MIQQDALARIRDQVKEELKEKAGDDAAANQQLLSSNSQILNQLGHSNSKDFSMQNNSLNEYKFGMISNGDQNSGAHSL